MSDLVKDLRKAEGSELLPKVILGNHRADVLCLKAAAEIEACWENINTKADWIEATINDMAAAEEATRASGWQDISTAPKDGTPFIGYRESCGDVGEMMWDNSGFTDVIEQHADLNDATHWMPLPEPPET